MTEIAFRAFPQGAVAIFETMPNDGSDVTLLSAPCNEPAAIPESHLDKIRFHSEFDYLSVALDQSVTINHTSIAAASNTTGVEVNSNYDVDGTTVDWELATHNLGYDPLVKVAVGSVILDPGHVIQMPGSATGAARHASVWVDSTKVYLREFRTRGSSSLGGTSITYRVLVFADQPDASGTKLMDQNPTTGRFAMGFDRFASDRRYVQVVPGGSPFAMCFGRTIDAKNGAPRSVAADGTVYEPVTSAIKQGIKASSEASVTYGPAMNYTGTFTGSTAVQIQAP